MYFKFNYIYYGWARYLLTVIIKNLFHFFNVINIEAIITSIFIVNLPCLLIISKIDISVVLAGEDVHEAYLAPACKLVQELGLLHICQIMFTKKLVYISF